MIVDSLAYCGCKPNFPSWDNVLEVAQCNRYHQRLVQCIDELGNKGQSKIEINNSQWVCVRHTVSSHYGPVNTMRGVFTLSAEIIPVYLQQRLCALLITTETGHQTIIAKWRSPFSLVVSRSSSASYHGDSKRNWLPPSPWVEFDWLPSSPSSP